MVWAVWFDRRSREDGGGILVDAWHVPGKGKGYKWDLQSVE